MLRDDTYIYFKNNSIAGTIYRIHRVHKTVELKANRRGGSWIISSYKYGVLFDEMDGTSSFTLWDVSKDGKMYV